VNEPEVRLRDFMDAIAEGDRSALQHLYKRTSDKLYGVVLRILRKPELAERALPDAYLRIWRDAPNYSPSLLSAEAWLVMHARRAAFDIARQRGLGLEPVTPDQATEADEPDAGREISDDLKHLLTCLATLDADPRLMLLLAYYDGWSRGELAVEFDAPSATIRTWMLRGLEQIREGTTPL
jgi:RNA polymerase sigma-70 factor (ECF subfamily)